MAVVWIFLAGLATVVGELKVNLSGSSAVWTVTGDGPLAGKIAMGINGSAAISLPLTVPGSLLDALQAGGFLDDPYTR